MRLTERFKRQENEDIILIAETIEKFKSTEFGELLLNHMIPNLQKMELQNSRTSNLSSERALGRIEAYETILQDLNEFLVRKEELQTPIQRNDDFETNVAEEQISKVRGGEI